MSSVIGRNAAAAGAAAARILNFFSLLIAPVLGGRTTIPLLMLLALASPERTGLEPLQIDYQQCLDAGVIRLAKVNEPAETIATAVMVACRPERAAMRAHILNKPNADPELVKMARKFLDDMEKADRDRVVAKVVEWRAARK